MYLIIDNQPGFEIMLKTNPKNWIIIHFIYESKMQLYSEI